MFKILYLRVGPDLGGGLNWSEAPLNVGPAQFYYYLTLNMEKMYLTYMY